MGDGVFRFEEQDLQRRRDSFRGGISKNRACNHVEASEPLSEVARQGHAGRLDVRHGQAAPHFVPLSELPELHYGQARQIRELVGSSFVSSLLCSVDDAIMYVTYHSPSLLFLCRTAENACTIYNNILQVLLV